ncbi:MAG: ThiF family adenylyltransferase, partial [Desulfobacteraceae bacterium]
LFSEIAEHGQELIQEASVLIVGCGALGTVSANHLARAGVGEIKIADRDFVELDNLQRQILFDEEDARRRLPKAVAAAEKLKRINSEIRIEPIIADVNPKNIESLINSAQVVLDATDNIETRFIINDACVKNGVPWIYAGVVGSHGMTMDILPGKTACFRCLMETAPPPGTMPTCDMVGVLNSVPAVIASIQATEALKIMVGHQERDNVLIYVDLWEGKFSRFKVKQHPDCPACGQREFTFLDGHALSESFSLCGRNAVQISPVIRGEIDLEQLKAHLMPLGEVEHNGFFLSFRTGPYELVIFPEGRTMVKGTTDESVARTLFAKYVGV